MTPTFSWDVNQDSNALLQREAEQSGSTSVLMDARFQRASERSRAFLSPHLRFERFTDPALGNRDDLSLLAGIHREYERAEIDLGAQYADESTLGTEIAATGIVRPNTHRRTGGTDLSVSYMPAESRILFAQFSYEDVSYYGDETRSLTGYRYPNLSLGERFVLSDRATLSLSAFEARLLSDFEGNDSVQRGLQLGVTYALSEVTRIDASVGGSDRKLAGQNSRGTVISANLSREMSRGRLTLGYTRNLVPYGYGIFVERQEFSASGLWQMTPALDAVLAARAIRNDQAVSGLLSDRKSYDGVSVALHWRVSETWRLDAHADGLRAQLADATDRAEQWRTGVGITWSPLPRIRSR